MGGWLVVRIALLVLLVVAVSGCTSWLDNSSASHLGFICRALDVEGEPDLRLHIWGEGWDAAALSVATEVEAALGREDVPISFEVEAAPDGSDAEEVAAWAEDHRFFRGRGLHMHLVWVPSVEGNVTGAVWAPGIVAVSREAVLMSGLAPGDAATGMALHQVGHALGLVNNGVPVLDRNITSREGSPTHSADIHAVMHENWHYVGASPGNTLAFSSIDHAEWAAARDGICAA